MTPQVEEQVAHEASLSQGAAAPASLPDTPPPAATEGTQVSGGEARADANASDESYTDSGRLTPEQWKAKAAKFKKPASESAEADSGQSVLSKKTPESAEPARGADGKFQTKSAQTPAKEGTQGEKVASAEGVATEKYTPNPKFSALGKDYDLPEWAQKALTSPEAEKQVKEVFEKAMGLEHVKMRHQELYQKHEQVSKQHSDFMEDVQELKSIYNGAVKSGNLLGLDDFFNKLDISPQVIMRYALQRAQLEEMDPAQRAAVEGQLEFSRRARELEKQNHGLSDAAYRAEVQARTLELNVALAKPDTAAIIQAFEASPGRKPGDFANYVRQHGEATWFRTQGQRDLKPEEAIKEVMAMFGLGQAPAPAAPAAQAATAPAPQAQAPATKPAPAPHQKTPVIPAVSGQAGMSPVKAKPRSIEDLRKLAKDRDAQATA